MKRSKTIALIVIVVLVLAGGSYLIFHKSNKPSNSTTSSTQAPPVNNSVLITKTNSSVGQYLAKPNGQPLYTYSADTSGVSNCSGSCIASWPAYQDTGSTANLPDGVGTIKRSDNGQTQYTYNGLPLYTFVGDTSGQVTGNNVMNFKIARPVSNPTANASSASTQAQSAASSTSSSSSGSPY